MARSRFVSIGVPIERVSLELPARIRLDVSRYVRLTVAGFYFHPVRLPHAPMPTEKWASTPLAKLLIDTFGPPQTFGSFATRGRGWDVSRFIAPESV